MTKPKTRVRIVHDSSPEDPREWDNVAELEHYDGRRGDSDMQERLLNEIIATKAFQAAAEMAAAADIEEPNLWDSDVREMWLDLVRDELIVLQTDTRHATLVAYVTPYGCQKMGTKWEDAERVAQSELETFRQYCEGDVYGVVIEEQVSDDDNDWQEVGACWGFYGGDPKTNGMRDHVPEELWPQLDICEVEYEY